MTFHPNITVKSNNLIFKFHMWVKCKGKYSMYSLPEPMKLLSKYSYYIWNIEHQTVDEYVERANKAISFNVYPYQVIFAQLNRLIDVRPRYTKKICEIAKKIILLHDGVVYNNLHPVIGYVIKDDVKLPDKLLKYIEKHKEEIETEIESGFKKGTLDHAILWDDIDEFKTLYFQQAKNPDEIEPEEPIIERDENGKIIRAGNNKSGFIFYPSEELAISMVEDIKQHNAEILAKRKAKQEGGENAPPPAPKEPSPEDLDPELYISPEDEKKYIKRDPEGKIFRLGTKETGYKFYPTRKEAVEFIRRDKEALKLFGMLPNHQDDDDDDDDDDDYEEEEDFDEDDNNPLDLSQIDIEAGANMFSIDPEQFRNIIQMIAQEHQQQNGQRRRRHHRRQEYDDDEEEYDEDSWMIRKVDEQTDSDEDIEYDPYDFEEDDEVDNEMDNYDLMDKAARYGATKIFFFLREYCFPHEGILQSACCSNKIKIVSHILDCEAGDLHSYWGDDIAYYGYRGMMSELEQMIAFTPYDLITNLLVDVYFEYYTMTGRIDNPTFGVGFTALMGAAEVGMVSLMDFLVSEGMDMNQRDEISGGTALHFAVKGNQPSAVKWLVDHGAKILKNSAGLTPLALAVQADFKEIVNILSANLEGTIKI